MKANTFKIRDALDETAESMVAVIFASDTPEAARIQAHLAIERKCTEVRNTVKGLLDQRDPGGGEDES